MKTDVLIIGGGVSGLMMARRLHMCHPELSVTIVDGSIQSEGQPVHPFHLHHLIPEVKGLDNIRPVTLHNEIYSERGFNQRATTQEINDYAMKTLGKLQITNCARLADSIIYPISKGEVEGALLTGIPSIHKVKMSAESVDLKENLVTAVSEGRALTIRYEYLISTIALPKFLALASVPHSIEFRASPFYTSQVALPEPTGLYQIIYNAHPGCCITRTTLLGGDLFIESSEAFYSSGGDAHFVYSLYGIKALPELKILKPGRFNLIPQGIRKSLLHWLTQDHNVMCLGRYGAWTFKVANDVWEDTAYLCTLISNKQMARQWRSEYGSP